MTGVFAFIYLNEPFNNNMQKNTPLFQFIGWFVESGCWWYGFGVILIYCQLFTIVSLMASSSWPFDKQQDGLLTVLSVARGCAVSNSVAFLSFWVQFKGLVGENGLSPAKDVVQYYKRLSQRHDDARGVA